MTRLFGFGTLMRLLVLLLEIHNNNFLSLGLSITLISAIEYGKTSKNYVEAVGLSLIITLATRVECCYLHPL